MHADKAGSVATTTVVMVLRDMEFWRAKFSRFVTLSPDVLNNFAFPKRANAGTAKVSRTPMISMIASSSTSEKPRGGWASGGRPMRIGRTGGSRKRNLGGSTAQLSSLFEI